MSDFVATGDDLKALCQLILQEAHKANSMGFAIHSLMPLVTEGPNSQNVMKELSDVQAHAKEIELGMLRIYQRNAKEAFGD